MNPHVPAMLAKARRTLEAARLLLEAEAPEDAVSRAYYAALQAASAALATEGVRPRTHRGTHGQFYERFVRAGRVPASAAEVLARAYTLRQASDYDFAASVSPAAAQELVEAVERLLRVVEGVVGEGEP